MRMFLKPSGNAIVRDPKSMQPLPKEGKEVKYTSYWVRRMEAGEVVLANRKKVEKTTKKKQSNQSENESNSQIIHKNQ